jgi:pSer/pThr/pTyr-binding forkhead associated (FHA) protein
MQSNMTNSGRTVPRQARLVVLSTNQVIPVVFPSSTDSLVVGRQDPSLGLFPDVDLHTVSQTVAQGKTIARRHAYLRNRQGTFTIEDLQSLYHTQLNGITLTPYQEYDLADGDLLHLGSIEVRFEIK